MPIEMKITLSIRLAAMLQLLLWSSSSSFQMPRNRDLRATTHMRPLQMHLGHSHTHSHDLLEDNDHDHNHDHGHKRQDSESFESSVTGGLASRWGKLVHSGNNPRAMLLFSSIFFIIPAIIRRKITKLDLSLFVFFASSLAFFGAAKQNVKAAIVKLKSIQQNLIRHSTPLTRKYFFKNENAADRVTLLGLWVNIALSVVKFLGGVFFHSAVLVADAGHSLSDLFSDFITLWAVQIARLPADDDHPYGHGKFEAVGSLFLSIILLFTGIGVGSWSYERMNQVLATSLGAASRRSVTLPSPSAMFLALLSIVSKEWLYRVTKRVGVALNNQVVIANAWHHRSDAFSSVLSLASIALAIFFPSLLIVDSAAGIFIAGMICMTGLEILGESMKQLTDTSDQTLNAKIVKLAEIVDGVQEVKSARARSIGSGSLVDITVLVDQKISSSAAIAITERVRWKIIEEVPFVMDVSVRTVVSNKKTCPLLVSGAVDKRSISDIEKEIRSVLMKNTDVQEVTKVTVHFIDNALVTAEAVICVNDNMTLKSSKLISKKLCKILMEKNDIHQVEIYLDASVSKDHSTAESSQHVMPNTINVSGTNERTSKFYGIGRNYWKDNNHKSMVSDIKAQQAVDNYLCNSGIEKRSYGISGKTWKNSEVFAKRSLNDACPSECYLATLS